MRNMLNRLLIGAGLALFASLLSAHAALAHGEKALEPFVRITRLVRSFTPHDELRGIRGEAAEGSGLEH